MILCRAQLSEDVSKYDDHAEQPERSSKWNHNMERERGMVIPSTRPLRDERYFQCKKKGHLVSEDKE
jgi:hypothetical protein